MRISAHGTRLMMVVATLTFAGGASAQTSGDAKAVRKSGSTILRDDGRRTAAEDPAVRQLYRRTGDVKQTTVDDPGTRIRAGEVGARVEPTPPTPAEVPPADGRVVQADRTHPDEIIGPALARELDRLRVCRAEVASRQRVAVDGVPVGSLELRFTVAADGTVGNSDVVALTPTDPAVLECVQRRMADWRFLNTAGRAFDVDRRYDFPGARRPAAP